MSAHKIATRTLAVRWRCHFIFRIAISVPTRRTAKINMGDHLSVDGERPVRSWSSSGREDPLREACARAAPIPARAPYRSWSRSSASRIIKETDELPARSRTKRSWTLQLSLTRKQSHITKCAAMARSSCGQKRSARGDCSVLTTNLNGGKAANSKLNAVALRKGAERQGFHRRLVTEKNDMANVSLKPVRKAVNRAALLRIM